MFKIPNNKKIIVSSSTDTEGNIYRTKNLTFDEPGKIKLANRTMSIGNSNDLTDLGSTYVMNIMEKESYKTFIGSDESLYLTDITGSTAGAEFPKFLKDSSTGTPTLNIFGLNDAVLWKSTLYLTNGTNIYVFDGGSEWTVFNSGNYEIIEPFVNLDKLAATNGNQIDLIDTSGTVTISLILPSQFSINSICWSNSRLYIATTVNNGQEEAVLFEWDGLSSTANYGYKINGNNIMSVVAYKNGCVYVDNKGKIAYYYSGSEQVLGYFPIFFKDNIWTMTGSLFNNKIGNRGMKVNKDKIYFSLITTVNSAFQDKDVVLYNDFAGGVWCYDPAVGLYHTFSIGQSAVLRTNDIATTDVNTTTNVITIAGITVPATGTPVFYKTNDTGTPNTPITGLDTGVRYFTIKVSDTTLKLSSTYSNAIAETAIDITGTGNNTQYLTFHPNYDFGGIANRVNNIMSTDIQSFHNVGKHLLNGQFIMSGKIQKGTGTSVSGTNSISVTQSLVENRGYFITPILESEQIEDIYNSIIFKYKKLTHEDDKIIVKYRTSETELPNTMTYYDAFSGNDLVITSANTFTTTKNISDVVVGDEMEIVSGAGAGYLAHVTAISENSGTYTVTIDEGIQNYTANDKCKAIFQNWTKLGSISSDDNLNYKQFSINKASKWIQFKIELRGIGTTIEELIVNNKNHKPVI